MAAGTCLPHLDGRARHNRTLIVVLLVLGTYGLALAMLLLGFAVEACVLTSAAVTGVAVQATRSAMLPSRTLRSYLAALPPQA
ncbi:hypothetical protein [Micromonospora sp. NPDC051296]|uniref:hypothetical protein n=1 Tax=Micromonospora sp. NPDC051296 TaxID=3155046 RepID=UPI003448F695